MASRRRKDIGHIEADVPVLIRSEGDGRDGLVGRTSVEGIGKMGAEKRETGKQRETSPQHRIGRLHYGLTSKLALIAQSLNSRVFTGN